MTDERDPLDCPRHARRHMKPLQLRAEETVYQCVPKASRCGYTVVVSDRPDTPPKVTRDPYDDEPSDRANPTHPLTFPLAFPSPWSPA